MRSYSVVLKLLLPVLRPALGVRSKHVPQRLDSAAVAGILARVRASSRTFPNSRNAECSRRAVKNGHQGHLMSIWRFGVIVMFETVSRPTIAGADPPIPILGKLGQLVDWRRSDHDKLKPAASICGAAPSRESRKATHDGQGSFSAEQCGLSYAGAGRSSVG